MVHLAADFTDGIFSACTVVTAAEALKNKKDEINIDLYIIPHEKFLSINKKTNKYLPNTT
ncbi:hypothetical protein [Pseudochrobactrum asaccharolyticum]|uniref:hypothetical protein n=1 Tax=Pseudochrobactrum asaccharolyticum TaxID=354351 RepID=UPI001FDEB2B3|nr:hypothetical protein [Pseudochrobactrum asaccharolyticum]